MAVNNYFIDTQPPLPFHHLDDAVFNAVLFEYEHGPLSFDFDRLESLIFNPIEHLPSVMENYFINNLDPDINFNQLMPPNSSYMVENEINNLLIHSHPVILHISTLVRRKFKISRQVFTPL